MSDPQSPTGAQPNQPFPGSPSQGTPSGPPPQQQPYGAPGQYGGGQYQQGQPPYGPPGSQPPYGPPGGQPTYGQPPYGQVPPQYQQQYYQAPPKPPSKAPKVLIVIGAVLLAVAVACGIVFATQIGSLIPKPDSFVHVDGPTSVDITGDEMKVIFTSDPSVSCDVTSPGAAQPDIWLDQPMQFESEGISFEAIGKIGGPGEVSGTYLIECDGPGVIIAPPLSVGGIGMAVLAAVVGGFAGVLGLILLIVGLVLRAGQKKRARL